MTKIKNTKKGMAKKTLSVSLAVAMLATSNVPVWAAEFSDGAEAAFTSEVEAPVVEIEAPVVEDETENVTVATAIDGIYEAKIELVATESEWGPAVNDFVTVNVSDTTKKASVSAEDGIKAVWKNKSGKQVPGTTIEDVKSADTKIALPKTTVEDFKNGEKFYLYLYSTVDETFEAVSDTVSIIARDISDDSITMAVKNPDKNSDSYYYTGREIKPTVTYTNNTDNVTFTLNYEGDLINSGTVKISAIANKEGYTGVIDTTYKIIPRVLNSSNVNQYVTASMVTKEFTYTGNKINVNKSDVVLRDKITGADISGLIATDASVTTGAKEATATADQQATIRLTTNTKEVSNFTISGNVTVISDKFSVAKLDLSNVEVTILPMEARKGYNSNNLKQRARYSYNGATVNIKDDIVFTDIPADTSVLGTYTVTVKPADGKNNVVNSTTAQLSLVAHDLSTADLYLGSTLKNSLDDVTYTGEEICPDMSKYTLKMGTNTLKAGTDYIVSYRNNINFGTASVVFTGMGSYAGSEFVINFNIKKASISSAKATNTKVAYVPSYTTANQYASAISLVVKTSKFTLEEGKDYTVEYKFGDTDGNKKDTTVIATITYSENFSATDAQKTVTVNVGKKAIKDSDIVMANTVYEYTGAAIKPDFKVMDGTTELKEGTDYTISYTKNMTSVGKAYLTIIGRGAYDSSFPATAEFEIVAATADDLVITTTASEYDGTQQKPSVTIKLKGNKLDDSDYDITYGENINAGKEAGTVTVTPKATNKNIEGTKTATFEIKKYSFASQDGKLTAYNDKNLIEKISSKVFNYDGTAHEFKEIEYTAPTGLGSKKFTDTDYEIVYVDNVYGKAVGTEQKGAILVLATEAGNYASSETYTDATGKVYKNVIKYEQFKIAPASFTLKEITVSNAEYAEGLVVKPTVVVKDGSKVLEEGKDYKLVLTGDSAAATEVTKTNTLVVKVQGINGYAGSEFAGLEWGVDRKDLKNTDITAKLTADNKVEVTVMNGKIKVNKSEYTVSELANGKVTVTAAKDSKHYTGSVEVEIPQKFPVGKAMIENVDVTGNTVAVKLAGEVENLVGDGDVGYDYVISKSSDCLNRVDRVAVNKTLPTTDTTFYYLEPGTYYAYCHAWTRDEDGMKAFGEWSNVVEFKVTAVTPERPQITSVKISGNTVTVTYTECEGAEGYDIVLGSTLGTDVAGYKRPYDYGKLVKKNVKAGTTTVTFKNVESGTYYVGLHAWSKEDGKKVFSKWSNVVTRTVK